MPCANAKIDTGDLLDVKVQALWCVNLYMCNKALPGGGRELEQL